jgi:rhodanese-related sulfurtransferase
MNAVEAECCKSIAPRDLQPSVSRGEVINLIDVRTPVEFRQIHAAPAQSLPLDRLFVQTVRSIRRAPDKPLYVICKSGKRAAEACKRLTAAGITDAVCVEGGTDAWRAAGLPVVSDKQVMSLERQVRIAAGLLVLIGVILGASISSWLYGLSALIGAGLVFAGITDTCGMGMLLAKMPWNQNQSCQS